MSQTIDSTPRQDNYRMPGEFEAHDGCWMLWPERPDGWRDGGKPAQRAYVRVAEAIARFESVTVAASKQQFQHARHVLPGHIRVVEMSYNGAWMRDNGPTFVINSDGDRRGVDWDFNAWGGLYFPWDQDMLVAQKVLEIERTDRYDAPFVLEGGSIHTDGAGTLITTKQCLLNPNRNPDLSQPQIEDLLCAYLNVEKIIWLDNGVLDDETSGHVDNLCCFIRPGVVALTWTDDQSDPQDAISQAAYELLGHETDAHGRPFEIHKLHQPGPLYLTAEERAGIDTVDRTLPRRAGLRLAASYVNFYSANGGVIVPTFDDPHDAQALETLQALFPDREVIGVPGREILLGGGNIHCITQQVPAIARTG